MNNQHTTEPWQVSDDEDGECIVFGKTTVAACEGSEYIDCNTSANARRIVACVNACAGITTDVLEDDCFNKMREDRDMLMKQRDELLAALNRQFDVAEQLAERVMQIEDQLDRLLAEAIKAAEEIRKCDYTPARSTLLVAIARVKGGAA